MFTRLNYKLPTAPTLPADPAKAAGMLKDTYFQLLQSIDGWFRSLNKKGALYGMGDPGTVTGTPTSGTGALTTAAYTLNWTALGDRFLYNGSVVITTNGTGATSIALSLPTGYVPKEDSDGTGCISSTRIQLVVKVGTGGTIAIVKYDGTYPGADGLTLLFSGQFRF